MLAYFATDLRTTRPPPTQTHYICRLAAVAGRAARRAAAAGHDSFVLDFLRLGLCTLQADLTLLYVQIVVCFCVLLFAPFAFLFFSLSLLGTVECLVNVVLCRANCVQNCGHGNLDGNKAAIEQIQDLLGRGKG